MRWLRGEQGAVAIVVALLAVAMFGFGALVIDIGALYSERRALQTGADASALAIAQDCAASECTPAGAAGAAAAYSDVNALDASAGVQFICSNAPVLLVGPQVTPCAGPEGMPAGASFVTVATKTRNPGPQNTNTVRPILSGILGNDGVPVGARATALWGGPGGTLAQSLPITFSYCEWAVLTRGGLDMPTWPLTTSDLNKPEIRDLERKITFFGGSEDPELNHCSEIASGSDLPEEPNPDTPGGFGWADGAKEGCTATDVEDGAYEKESGNTDGDCSEKLISIYDKTWTSGTPELLYLPVYETVDNGTYRLQTYIGFVLTGFRLGTGCGPASSCQGPSLVSNATHPAGELCHARNWQTGVPYDKSKQNQVCLTGFFVKAPPPVNSTVGGPSLGVTVFNLFS